MKKFQGYLIEKDDKILSHELFAFNQEKLEKTLLLQVQYFEITFQELTIRLMNRKNIFSHKRKRKELR